MTKKKIENDAAGGVTPPAKPGRKKVKSRNKVIFLCDVCDGYFVENRTDSKCLDCDKEMKEIGNVEYHEEV